MLPVRKFSESSVSLEVDLEKMFGKKVVDPALRRNIGEALIDIVLKRTEAGYGVTNGGDEVKLKGYSAEYIASDEFKAFGKSKGKVNMTLTGSMLASVDILTNNAKTISIGIENEEAPKAFNHLTADTIKTKRPWLGLTSTDIESVRKEYEKEVGKDQAITVKDIFELSNLSKIANIVGARNKIGFKP